MGPESRLTRWEGIRERLLADIRVRRLRPGAKLASERDLAKELGVSHPTVHKALASLAADGYVTRQVGRGTFVTDGSAKRSGAVAMYFGKWANPFDDPILFRVCAGISSACQEKGLDLFFHTPQDVRLASPAEYLRTILDRGCDGLLCLAHVRHEIVEEVAESLPTVIAANLRVKGLVPRLVADQAAAVAAGVRHLAALGRRRIALVGSAGPDYSLADDIVAGYREALIEQGLAYDEALVSCTPASAPQEFRYGISADRHYWFDRRMFGLVEPPDGVVAINPGMAHSVYEFALAEGIGIGSELGVVCVMDSHWTENVSPGCTAVDFLSEELGRQALDLLEAAIEGRVDRETEWFGEPKVIVRESCGSPAEMRTPARRVEAEVVR